MEHFRSHPQTLLETRSTNRTNHKFLESDRSVAVRTAIDDIHHRHRHYIGVRAPDIPIQWNIEIVGCRLCHSKRNPQNRIGPQVRFGFRPIKFQHRIVNGTLVQNRHSHQGRGNHLIDVFNRFLYAFTSIAVLIAVTQLQRLMFSGRSTRRNRSTPHYTRFQPYIYLNSRVSSRIEDFTSCNLFYSHLFVILK